MQKLKRGDCPTVLTKRQKSEARGRAAWRTLSLEEKRAIWVALEAMQGTRCAYCETDTTEGKRHIEHFRPLSQYPKQTFNWSNLSVSRKTSPFRAGMDSADGVAVRF